MKQTRRRNGEVNQFKICSKCEYTWKSRDDFLKDRSICLVGFQVGFKKNESGHYLFNHILEDNRCNTTLAVEVEAFLSLYQGDMFPHVSFGSPTCEEHCLSITDLSRCPVACKNAVARHIMQIFAACREE